MMKRPAFLRIVAFITALLLIPVSPVRSYAATQEEQTHPGVWVILSQETLTRFPALKEIFPGGRVLVDDGSLSSALIQLAEQPDVKQIHYFGPDEEVNYARRWAIPLLGLPETQFIGHPIPDDAQTLRGEISGILTVSMLAAAEPKAAPVAEPVAVIEPELPPKAEPVPVTEIREIPVAPPVIRETPVAVIRETPVAPSSPVPAETDSLRASIRQLSVDVEELKRDRTRLESEKEALLKARDEAQSKALSLEKRLQEARAPQPKSEQAIQKLQDRVEELSRLLDSTKESKAGVETNLKTLQKERDQLASKLQEARAGQPKSEQAIQKLQDRIDELSRLLDSTKESKAGVETNLKALQKEREELKAAMSREAGESNQAAAKWKAQADRLQASVNAKDAELQQKEEELARLKQLDRRNGERAASLEKRLQEREGALLNFEKGLKNAEGSAAIYSQELAKAREENKGLAELLQSIREQLWSEQTENKKLKDSLAELDGNLSSASALGQERKSELEKLRSLTLDLTKEKEKQRLEGLELQRQLQVVTEERAGFSKQVEILRADSGRLAERVKQSDERLASTAKSQSELSRELQQVTERAQGLALSLEETRKEKLASEARLEEAQRQLGGLQSAQQKFQSQLASVTEDLRRNREAYGTAQKAGEELEKKLAETEKALAETDAARQKLIAQVRSQSADLEAKQRAIEAKQEELSRLTGNLDETAKRSEALRKQLQQQQEAFQKGRIELQESERKGSDTAKDLALARNEIKALGQKVADTQEKLHAREAVTRKLTDAVDALERKLSIATADVQRQELEIGRLRGFNSEMVKSRGEALSEMADLKQDLQQSGERSALLEKELAAAVKRGTDLHATLKETEGRLEMIQKGSSELQKSLSSQLETERRNAQALKASLEETNSRNEQLSGRLRNVEDVLKQTQLEAARLGKGLQEKEEALKEQKRQAELLQQEKSSLEAAWAESKKLSAGLQDQLREREKALLQLRQTAAESQKFSDKLQEELADARLTVERLGKELSATRLQLQAAQKENADRREAADKLEHDIAQISQERTQQAKEIERLQLFNSELSKTRDMQGDTIREMKLQMARLLEEGKKLDEQLTASRASGSKTDQQLKETQKDLARALDDYRKVKARGEFDAAEFAKKAEMLESGLKESLKEKGALQVRLKAAEKGLTDSAEEKQRLGAALAERTARLQETEKSFAVAQERIKEKETDFQRVASDLEQSRQGNMQLRETVRVREEEGLAARKENEALQEAKKQLDARAAGLDTQIRDLKEALGKNQSVFTETQKALMGAQTQIQQLQQEAQYRSAALDQSQQQLAELRSERLKLTEALSHVRQLNTELTQARERQEVRLESEQAHVADLQDRLRHLEEMQSTLQKEAAALAEASNDSKRSSTDLQEKVKRLERSLTLAESENLQLKQSMGEKEEELKKLSSALGDLRSVSTQSKSEFELSQQSLLDLQDQLKISQKVQGEQLAELRMLRDEASRQKGQLDLLEQERDTLKLSVTQREEQLDRLQTERTALRRDLADAQMVGQKSRVEAQGREEQLSMEGKSIRLEIERLQGDLQKAQNAYQQSLEDRESLKSAYDERIKALTAQLQDRENAISGLRNDLTRPMTEQVPAIEPKPVVQAPQPVRVLPPSARQATAPAAAADGGVAAVKVYRIEEKMGFLVLSIETQGWAKAGQALILSSGGQDVYEVELGDIDSAGLAMAYITKKIKKLPVQKGEFLSAKPMILQTASASEPAVRPNQSPSQ